MNNYPVELRDDLNYTLVKTIYEHGIVNVPVLAANWPTATATCRSLTPNGWCLASHSSIRHRSCSTVRKVTGGSKKEPAGWDNDGLLLDIVQNEYGRAG